MTVTYEGATEQVRQVVHHHAVLRRGLERRAGTLCEAAEDGIGFQRQMTTLREYLTGEILTHAQAEERTGSSADLGRRARRHLRAAIAEAGISPLAGLCGTVARTSPSSSPKEGKSS